MAQVVSRVPPETWLQVAGDLSFRDRHMLMLASRMLHGMIAPMVYRTLVLKEQRTPRGRPGYTARRGDQRSASRTLACLLLSVRLAGSLHNDLFYPALVRSISLISYIPTSNLRLIPMFIEALIHMSSLESLRIDICEESTLLLITLLDRKQKISLERSFQSSMWNLPSPTSSLPFPQLVSIRSNRYEVAAWFLRWRALTTLVLDRPVYPCLFRNFIQDSSTMRPASHCKAAFILFDNLTTRP